MGILPIPSINIYLVGAVGTTAPLVGCVVLFFFLDYLQFVVVGSHQLHYLVVELYARPGVDSGILLLLVGEYIRLPVGEALSFADFLAEEVGVEFLQAFILDTDIADDVLDVDEPTRFELATAMEREQVVVPRETNHRHEFVAEQAHERIGQTDVVETEQKALVVGGNLQ